MDNLALAQLASWGISPEDAEAARLFYTPSARSLYEEMPERPGMVIPYFTPDRQWRTFQRNGKTLPFSRIRWLGPDPKSHAFTKHKPVRYTQPTRTGVAPYFWPGADWPTILSDPQWPIIMTEGEAKAIVGCIAGFSVIALGGVFSFTDKSSGEMLAEMDAIAWKGREVFICYDSDAATNPNVLAAEARLVDELQRKRGAQCRLVRLPPAGDGKQGLDDYLKANGPGPFAELLQAAPTLGALDAKILGLNKSVAWIEREAMVYDMGSKLFIQKDSFINGSQYSALKHVTISAQQRTTKEISIAQKWLTHSHAQRFDEILFRPGEGVTLTGEHGRLALNMWTGFEPAAGDVAPFLELTKHLFQNMRAADRELPLLTMIYKAQNPQVKIPLALIVVGPEGSGKSLWGECMRDAFSPYGASVSPTMLTSDFRGWLETSLLVLINEAKGDDMRKGAETLRTLISDTRQDMNEKFRPSRQINTYASYIITANDRAVGAFRADDRRMIVVNAPKPDQTGLYDRVHNWKAAGGPRSLMGWMLAYDLKGWEPPDRAPQSAEKYLAYIESLTPIQRLAEEMQTAGESTIRLWLDSAVAWANTNLLSNSPTVVQIARGTLDSIQHYQIRPWYQPEELTNMFPAIISQTLGSKMSEFTPAGKISRELRDAGVPYLESADDPRGFKWRGRVCQFLVVSDFDAWRKPISQAEFEARMGSWPTYGQLKGSKLR